MLDTLPPEARVSVDAEGYLTDPAQWTEAVAEAIADEEGIALTPEHWAVVNYLRDQHAAGVALTLRRVGKSGVTTIKDLYRLFPGGPLKKATRIAGIPKPQSCV